MQEAQTAEELGRELRSGDGRVLRRRRRDIRLNLFSLGVLGGIALYQTGILKKLPEPGWGGFDAERVNGSAQAYPSAPRRRTRFLAWLASPRLRAWLGMGPGAPMAYASGNPHWHGI